MEILDYVVVGSGCAGAMAAQTLVEAGAKVTMLDVGITDTNQDALPNKDFLTIRKTEPDQYKYFIGEKAEGVSWGSIGKGSQITPSRYHMLQDVDKYLLHLSKNFSPMESLGYGGLGIGWGLQCWAYSDADLQHTGLDPADIKRGYDIVSQRIGISGTKDAAAKYTLGSLKNFQPSVKMDRNHQLIMKKYSRHQKRYAQSGIFLGRTPLALLSQSLSGRQPYQYEDMDFYSDKHKSAWRPWITIDALRKKTNFSYKANHLVTKFVENNDYVEVHCINTKTDAAKVVRCRRLVLGSGNLGTARIVLRSLGNEQTKLPLLSNPHSYVPCVQPSMFGKGTESKKLGFGQLSLFVDKAGSDEGLSVASTYSYQSLMMFRVITQLPMNFNDARKTLGYLLPGLIIMILQHPDGQSSQKYLQLKPLPASLTGDALYANYRQTDQELKLSAQREKQYAKAMRKFGVYAVKGVHTPHGSAIHYAGCLPYETRDREFTLDPNNGRLHGSKNIYVVDSSGFNYLPAKGLTLTLMANATVKTERILQGA